MSLYYAEVNRTIGPVAGKLRDPFAEFIGSDRLAVAATLWGKQEGRWFRRRTHPKNSRTRGE